MTGLSASPALATQTVETTSVSVSGLFRTPADALRGTSGTLVETRTPRTETNKTPANFACYSEWIYVRSGQGPWYWRPDASKQVYANGTGNSSDQFLACYKLDWELPEWALYSNATKQWVTAFNSGFHLAAFAASELNGAPPSIARFALCNFDGNFESIHFAEWGYYAGQRNNEPNRPVYADQQLLGGNQLLQVENFPENLIFDC